MLTRSYITFQVQGYPTLKVYHKGEEVKAYRGKWKASVDPLFDWFCIFV
jgi:hypothetical protein